MTALTKMNMNVDRVIKLAVADGASALSSTGLIDKRLFTGENKLHAVKDPQTCFWYLKYDSGAVPEPLKQKFTGFNALLKHVEQYFRKRNIVIKEIID